MTKANRKIVGFVVLIFSAILSYLLVVDKYFPYFSMAVALSTLSSAVYFLKRFTDPQTNNNLLLKFCYILTLVFSFFIFYRTNPLLVMLNIIAVFYLGSLMTFPNLSNKINGFLLFVFSPLLLLVNSVSGKNDYTLNFPSFSGKNIPVKEADIVKLIKSLGLTFAVLIVIIPLLSSANPIFSKLVSDFFKLFRLRNFFEFLFSDDVTLWTIRLFVFFFLALVIPRMLTYSASPAKERIINNFLSSFHLMLPKLLIAIVIGIFFNAQAQLYFASDETLRTLGYTHSQYAREVFAQLSIVALIILGLVYNEKSKKKFSAILTYILVIEGIFLTFIALKSVNDYSSAWGFTYKRLWGYTGVVWIFSVFIIFLYKYFKKLSDSCFIKSTVIFSALVLMAVNIVNFDYLIFNYRKSITQRGVDYYYLSHLSSDAKAYRQLLQLINTQMTGMDTGSSQYGEIAAAGHVVLKKIDFLQKKYKTVDFRSINLSEFMEYQTIRSLDTTPYRQAWK